MRRLLLAAALLPALAGCGTILDACGASRIDSPPGPHVYGGVRLDVDYLTKPSEEFPDSPIFFLMDLSLSAVLDTVFLLFTVPWSLAQ
jgi:uncharacterized protein YceK